MCSTKSQFRLLPTYEVLDSNCMLQWILGQVLKTATQITVYMARVSSNATTLAFQTHKNNHQGFLLPAQKTKKQTCKKCRTWNNHHPLFVCIRQTTLPPFYTHTHHTYAHTRSKRLTSQLLPVPRCPRLQPKPSLCIRIKEWPHIMNKRTDKCSSAV